jgi:hypothetical protein
MLKRDICVVRANTYKDSVGDVWWKIYTCCTKLENNDVLISRLRTHVFNNRTWDASASSKCQVLAFTSNIERENRMVDEMVSIHRANATTINDELHKLDALEDQIQRAKLTLNLRLTSSTTIYYFYLRFYVFFVFLSFLLFRFVYYIYIDLYRFFIVFFVFCKKKKTD